MTDYQLAPNGAANRSARLGIRSIVNQLNRGFVASVAAMIAVALSPLALSSEAHADRGWSLGSAISQTYKKRNWSGPAKLGHPVKKSGYAKKRRVNKSAKKNYKIYRKKSRNKSKKKSYKVASLNKTYGGSSGKKKSLSGGGVRWVASSSCLNGRLKSIINQVASKYGSVTVSSTCRSKSRNARVGGARRSKHLTGNAVDFRVHGRYGAAYAYLKSAGGVGGYKHYGGGLFHIDTGPRRTW